MCSFREEKVVRKWSKWEYDNVIYNAKMVAIFAARLVPLWILFVLICIQWCNSKYK